MLEPLFIEPKVFMGKKLQKISIDNLNDKIKIVESFYHEYRNHTKESNLEIANLLKTLFYNSCEYKVSEKEGFSTQKGEMDLSIRDLSKENLKRDVLFELKKPNDKDMIEKNNFFKKSFYQAVYYYLSDKEENNHQSDIKFIIITDNIKWFFIRTKDLDDTLNNKVNKNQQHISFNIHALLTQDSYDSIENFLKKVCDKNTSDTDLFSSSNNTTLPYTYFNLHEMVHQKQEEKLEQFLKCLSDAHLLNKVDLVEKNSLNQKFYKELLYIIGLKEVKNKNKITLEQLDNKFSFMAITQKALIDECGEKYDLSQEEIYEISLELCLIWINRLLFIELFSSVLQTYKVTNSSILDLVLNKNGSIFNLTRTLFFNVLNLPKEQREKSDIFKQIPYINSSLFQKEEIEDKYISINALDDDTKATFYVEENQKGILKYLSVVDSKLDGKINILEYFIHFLNAYDIAVDENFSDNSNKDLINASVLGKIFEKINGYQDGAFYTPSYITEYMANDSIKSIILQKFQQNGFVSKDLHGLKKEIFIDDKQKEANEIFSSITICDPAVGSGHFLVSSLNSMLYYKCQLGLFEYLKPNQLEIVDDSIIIHNIADYSIEEANEYNLIHNIYTEIYRAKKDIICNSIFGVDLNANSVKISRLRLWIELLKHTYFTQTSDFQELVLLPNIDINIKQGNSLISQYPLDYEFNHKTFNSSIYQEYYTLTQEYKTSLIKKDKQHLLTKINTIKQKFISNCNTSFFEWRYEFPEILDKEGNFVGFDLMIGNPPYIRIQDLRTNYPTTAEFYDKQFQSATGKYDIYVLFLEKAISLCQANGYNQFIIPHKFLISDFGKGIRSFLKHTQSLEKIIHFGSEMIFEDATIYSCITTLSKNKKEDILFCNAKTNENLEHLNYTPVEYTSLGKNRWNLVENNVYNILEKIKQQPLQLLDIFKGVNQGIKTGDDKIFVLEGEIKGDLFIGFSKKLNQEIKIEKDIVLPILKGESIKRYQIPKNKLFVIYAHKLLEENKTAPIEERELEEKYPLTYSYLLNFKSELINKKIRYKTNKKYWYSLHRARDLENIKCKKIVLPEISFKSNMTLDTKAFTHIGQYNLVKNDNIQEDEKYFLSILNSDLMWFFIKNTSSEFRGGYFAFQSKYLEEFSFPLVENSQTKQQLINYVNLLYTTKNESERKSIEDKINNIVYSLYDLSIEEVDTIKQNISVS